MNRVRSAAILGLLLGLAGPALAQTTTTVPQPAAPAAAPQKAHLLTPDEIKKTFATGKAFAASTPGGKVILITLKPDGAASAVPKGSKKGKKGTWHVSDTGYCSTWGKGKENCYQVRELGAGFDVETVTGTVVAHWTAP